MLPLSVTLPLIMSPSSTLILHMGNPCVQTGIQICIWQSPYADREEANVVSPYANGDCPMHMGIPICIRGLIPERGWSLYAYGNPHLHTGLSRMCSIPIYIWGLLYAYGDPHMHTGILSMLICILGMGQQQNLQSLYAYGDWPSPHMHTGINNLQSRHACGDWQGLRMHMGIVQSLTHLQMVCVCIWGFGHQIPICKNLHMGIPVCIWGSITKNRQKNAYGDPRLQMVFVCIWWLTYTL